MIDQYEIACGLDIHKQFIVGTISSSQDRIVAQQRFERSIDGLLSLSHWVSENKCQVVACESTNTFWYQVYDALADKCPVIVGNAHDMKVVTHKKTDKIDSENIALLALKGMITPSHVLPAEMRSFREVARLRAFLVQKRTDIKNRISTIYNTELFHLSTIFTDVFGKTGLKVIHGITQKLSVEKILSQIPKNILKQKKEQLQELLQHKLSQSALDQLKTLVSVLDNLNQNIQFITQIGLTYVAANYARENAILQSVPGIGEIAALYIMAEVGNFHDFVSADKLTAWAGIVPKVYQSADHSVNCGITRRGSRLLRWIMVQAAHAASRKKNSKFYEFYAGKKDRLGNGKTSVALARKMLAIIWHLITQDEMYEDEYKRPQKMIKTPAVIIRQKIDLDATLELFIGVKKILDCPDGEEEKNMYTPSR